MVVARHERVEWEETDSLDATERGAGGFGSTGR
jgi:dUTP pyrophosphatase